MATTDALRSPADAARARRIARFACGSPSAQLAQLEEAIEFYGDDTEDPGSFDPEDPGSFYERRRLLRIRRGIIGVNTQPTTVACPGRPD